MLKKMLCLLTAALLLTLCVPVLAEEAADADPLGWEELRTWAEGCLEKARGSELLNDPTEEVYHTEDGYAFVYSFATLYLDAPALTEESEVQAIVLYTAEIEGPRGIRVDRYAQEVLAAYYSENDTLAGTQDAAVLYLRDDMPEGVYWGWVQRDGQRIQVIEYAACEALETGGEGYANAGVTYLLEENMVSAIRVYGLNDRLDADALLDRCAELEAVQAESGYTQVPASYVGTDLTAFGPEDLSFSGLSFPGMSAEQAVAMLGRARSESWMQDDDGSYIQVLAFDGCELTFRCDEKKENARLELLTIFADALEGPRGLRVGDSLPSVLNRFRHGENEFDDTTRTELLYGAENVAPWGLAEYGMDGTTLLRYTCALEDGTVVHLLCTFDLMELDEVMLYLED